MSDTINPLIPTGYDVAWWGIAALLIMLTVVALVTLARCAGRLTPTQALIWTVIVLFVPVVGPIAWLAIGRRAVPAPRKT